MSAVGGGCSPIGVESDTENQLGTLLPSVVFVYFLIMATAFSVPFFLNRIPAVDGVAHEVPPCRLISPADVLSRSLFHPHFTAPSVVGEWLQGSDGRKAVANAAPEWHTVMFSNYMTDIDWMLTEAAPQLLVGLSGGATKQLVFITGDEPNYSKPTLSPLLSEQRIDVTVVKPKLPISYGTHHSKAIIAFSKKCVRVCVTTSNHLCGDWTRKNQGLYVQDFPVTGLCSTRVPSTARPNDFGEYLAGYFRVVLSDAAPLSTAVGTKNLGAARSVMEQLLLLFSAYDYSSAAGDLVASVPGYHQLGSRRHIPGVPVSNLSWGLERMGQVLEGVQQGSSSHSLELVAQYSSQGALNEKFIEQLCASMTPRGGNHPGAGKAASLAVVFPSEDEVRTSVEGWRAGMSIPVHQRSVTHLTRARMYQWGTPTPVSKGAPSARLMAMPHIKTYVVHPKDSLEVLQFTCTSANLSRAAWGEYQKNKTQIMIRSYELGVSFTSASLRRFACGCDNPKVFGEIDVTTAKSLYPHIALDANTMGFFFLPHAIVNKVQFTPEDRQWIVDGDHRGQDMVGRTIVQAFETSHYGPAAWQEPMAVLSQKEDAAASEPTTGGSGGGASDARKRHRETATGGPERVRRREPTAQCSPTDSDSDAVIIVE